jgi:hypothetical protein
MDEAFEILRSSNGVGDCLRFWNVVGDHDHQMELEVLECDLRS